MKVYQTFETEHAIRAASKPELQEKVSDARSITTQKVFKYGANAPKDATLAFEQFKLHNEYSYREEELFDS